jgi:hypothetical protein
MGLYEIIDGSLRSQRAQRRAEVSAEIEAQWAVVAHQVASRRAATAARDWDRALAEFAPATLPAAVRAKGQPRLTAPGFRGGGVAGSWDRALAPYAPSAEPAGISPAGIGPVDRYSVMTVRPPGATRPQAAGDAIGAGWDRALKEHLP